MQFALAPPLPTSSQCALLAAMTLNQYLKSHERGELTALAGRLGTSKGYLHDIAKGNRRPSVEMAKAIEKATGGQVPAMVLLGLAKVA